MFKPHVLPFKPSKTARKGGYIHQNRRNLRNRLVTAGCRGPWRPWAAVIGNSHCTPGDLCTRGVCGPVGSFDWSKVSWLSNARVKYVMIPTLGGWIHPTGHPSVPPWRPWAAVIGNSHFTPGDLRTRGVCGSVGSFDWSKVSWLSNARVKCVMIAFLLPNTRITNIPDPKYSYYEYPRSQIFVLWVSPIPNTRIMSIADPKYSYYEYGILYTFDKFWWNLIHIRSILMESYTYVINFDWSYTYSINFDGISYICDQFWWNLIHIR